MAPTHQPGDQRNNPAANHTTPKYVARRYPGRLYAHVGHRRYKLGAQGAGFHGEEGKEKGSQNIAGKNDGP